MKNLFFLISFLFIIACAPPPEEKAEPNTNPTDTMTTTYKTIGGVERLSDTINQIISQDANVEILADGYDWSEGPLWLPTEQKLIWSDIPQNTIYQWKEGEEVKTYLTPSGFTSAKDREGELGSNGLLLSGAGELVLCQHGDRRVAKMKSSVASPSAEYETLADNYEGKKFNSPNDAAYGPDDYLYFTDPPYGLTQQMDDPKKEIDFQGVFRISPDGEVKLMIAELTRPNGITFTPDKKKCYVANSDPKRAIWMVYDVDENRDLVNGKVFFDATSMTSSKKGLPDGLKINQAGTIFATGPGGVLVFTPEGEHLGTVYTGTTPISNCELDDQEKTLYMTADNYIVRIKLL